MHLRTVSVVFALGLVASGGLAASALPSSSPGSTSGAARAEGDLARAVSNVSRSTAWERTDTLDLDFDTFHPQAMEVTEDRIYLSSVEIIEPTVRYPQPVDGYDRSPGKGVGHLFVLDRQGRLLEDVVLGEGDSYHPGGLDVDADGDVWLPVAEYRPNSAAIVYRVDGDTLEPEKMFTVHDHIGGVVLDRTTGRVVGQSWGSRRFYEWTTDGKQRSLRLNPSHFIDHQDCEYADSGKALCSGVAGLPAQPGAATGYELGGLALLDIASGQVLHEVPTQLWSTAGHVVTRNPVDVDAEGNRLTMYAAPDDAGEGAGTQLLTYEAEVTELR